jgi:hypothetical protein
MRVTFFEKFAIVFNEYGECAKLEGKLFSELLRGIRYRKTTGTRKTEKTLAAEIVQAWPREMLEWGDVKNANK